MDWSSNRTIVAFSLLGLAAVLISGAMVELLLPDEGLWQIVRGVIPAGIGAVFGVYMMREIGESRLSEIKS